jgi:hypothetical protein
MAFWFYRGVRKGIATTRYPKTVDPWARGLPSAPGFHTARLTIPLVDRLARECPAAAIVREDLELVVDLGRCTGCGCCVGVGEGAVRPTGEFLLSTADRTALIKRVPIRGDERMRNAGR